MAGQPQDRHHAGNLHQAHEPGNEPEFAIGITGQFKGGKYVSLFATVGGVMSTLNISFNASGSCLSGIAIYFGLDHHSIPLTSLVFNIFILFGEFLI